MVNNPCIVTNLPPFQFHIVLFPCKQAPEHDHWVLHLKRSYFGIRLIKRGILYLKRTCFDLWLIKRGILLLERACFPLWLLYLIFTIRINQVKSNRTDRTNRNILCPYVIMRCTLRMCSEYGLLTMLTVCTERTIR